MREAIVDAGMDPIFLISPTTTDARIRRSAELGRGFLYLISRLGVTGVRNQLAADAASLTTRVRACTDMPMALGFGIATPDHVAEALPQRRRGGRRQRAGQLRGGARGRRRPLRAHLGVCPVAEEQVVIQLEALRRRIDALDEELVRLLSARAACALEIGRVKKQAGMDVYQPAREAEVLAHVQASHRRPPDPRPAPARSSAPSRPAARETLRPSPW